MATPIRTLFANTPRVMLASLATPPFVSLARKIADKHPELVAG